MVAGHPNDHYRWYILPILKIDGDWKNAMRML